MVYAFWLPRGRGRACPARGFPISARLPYTAGLSKNSCRGEHCSPVPVCLARNYPGKCVAAVSWRATNGRPYTSAIFYHAATANVPGTVKAVPYKAPVNPICREGS